MGKQRKKRQVQGGKYKTFYHHLSILSFLRFFGADRAGGKTAISQSIWGVEYCQDRELEERVGRRDCGSFGCKGGVDLVTGENVLVCCFCPDGGIWASGTMVEVVAVPAAPEMGM